MCFAIFNQAVKIYSLKSLRAMENESMSAENLINMIENDCKSS